MSNEVSITKAQIELVKETWKKIIPISDIAAKNFYVRLFDQYPEIKPMFDGADLLEQCKKLIKAINMVAVSLERIETLIPMIRELGQRHVSYGVEDQHYGQVGETLLWTLEAGLKEAWSKEVEAAWTNAYTLLAGVMIEGANEPILHAA
jgi:hemoglobin-like flavoprotein